jgi:hypothetical protein
MKTKTVGHTLGPWRVNALFPKESEFEATVSIEAQ